MRFIGTVWRIYQVGEQLIRWQNVGDYSHNATITLPLPRLRDKWCRTHTIWQIGQDRQFQGTIGEVSELNFTIHTQLDPEVFQHQGN